MTKDQLAALRVEFHQAINNHDWVAAVHIGARLMSHDIDPTRLITEVYDDYADKATTMRDTIRLQNLTNDTLRGQLERGGVSERIEAAEATIVSPLIPAYTVTIGEIVESVTGPAEFVLEAICHMNHHAGPDGPVNITVGAFHIGDDIDKALKAPEEPGAAR